MGQNGKKSDSVEDVRKKDDLTPRGMVLATLAIVLPPLLAMVVFPTPQDEGFLPLLPTNLLSSNCSLPEIHSASSTVSIIIPYYHEEWFRLEITLRSILRHTNMKLIQEILLVSDGNGQEGIFQKKLQAMSSKVEVIVNQENKGLIVTKMEAAARAKASVLMFLEPHVVVTPGWLEPLLARLEQEMKTYAKMSFMYWRFEWNLNLIACNPLQKDINPSMPYPSPATSGGIYAIRKEWWDHLEFFDPKLIRWGGDHVEASHKVWRCGGRVEIHPCSRVGHWFREAKDRPYTVEVPDVVRNYKRLAEVWLDDHKKSFYKVKPEARPMDIGDLQGMKATRERLQCHDMDWYLKNVDVELAWEENHICIPGASKDQHGCTSKTAAPQRSTLDKVMSVKEFRKAQKLLSPEFRLISM